MSESLPDCTPFCKRFRCDRKPSAMKIRRTGGKKEIWCDWVDDTCDGAWCQYSICLDRKMTDDGKCRKVKKPKIDDIEDGLDDEDLEKPIPKKYVKKIRGKPSVRD